MRSLLASLMIALLGLGLTACGDAGKGAGSSTRSSSTAANGRAPAPGESAAASQSAFRGDEDDDESAGNHTSDTKNDNDADFDNDTHENTGYYDGDDKSMRAYGRAPSAADGRTIAALVSRYFAAAAAGDGAKACPLIYSILEEAIPEDYGQPPGPLYARGKTCAVVMSKLFEHAHSQLAGKMTVTAVRINGREARALLGSRTMPASFMIVKRERGAWKIDGLLGERMP